MENNETCVPASAVQKDGQPLQTGADIEVTLKGKVSRVEGDQVYFKPTEANGQPIEDEAAGEEETDDQETAEPTEDSLRAAAAKQDEMGG